MNVKLLLASVALPSTLLFGAGMSYAQVEITEETTTAVQTSTAGENDTPDDLTITSSGSVKVESGTAVTIDSSNTVTNQGTIEILDANDAVGVDIQAGNEANFSHSGNINITEDYSPSDTDDDGVVDGTFAEGSGRTGILISGSGTLNGNISLDTGSSVTVEGNDSFTLRLLESAVLSGDITASGAMTVVGNNSRVLSLEGNVDGTVTNRGRIVVLGENSSAIVAEGDISGQLNNSGSITNTGYRFSTRPNKTGRDLLDEEDLLQAGSAILVNGNVGNGIFLEQVIDESEDDEGNVTQTVRSTSSISQFGQAPAVLIDGNGTPISVGLVAEITDPEDENFDSELQYAFVNQGALSASGVYDDINATAFEVREATLANGINNTNTMRASTFRSGNDGSADAEGQTGLARVIVIGDQAIAETINNSGLIFASVTEAGDEIYADRENIVPARHIRAVAIDIESGGNVSRLINSQSITALVTGRNGEAIAVRDSSGTLTFIENTGSIAATARTSDSTNSEATEFNLIALDLTANTSGVTINQFTPIDEDPDDDTTPPAPFIAGSILLGSGDDTITAEAGRITGDIAFGEGADRLTLSGDASYIGEISDTDGNLTIATSGTSTLVQTGDMPINITSATFSDESTYRPTLNGETGNASTLFASGDINVGEGVTISPILDNVVTDEAISFNIFDAGGSLNFAGNIDSLQNTNSPFLYDITYSLDPNNPNSLIVTLDLRTTEELGLDSNQSASFASTFEALRNNQDLSNAIINITEQAEFNAAINQLLPEFSAAAQHFVAANVDGAVGAVATHLENTRRSTARPGGLWLEEFAFFADRERAQLSEQYRGHGFGLTGGMDTALGPFHTVGLNLGFASTEIEYVLGSEQPLDVVTFQLGGYAGLDLGGLGIEAYAGGGYNDFEQTRTVSIGSFSDKAEGDWSGTHYNASLRSGYSFDIGEKFWIRPAVSVDYLSLSEKAYTEDGALGIALNVDKRKSELGGATAMLNFGAKLDGRRTWLHPSLRVGYRNEFINDNAITNYGFVGLDRRASLTASDFPNSGLLFGFSIAAGSSYSSFGLDFDSDIRDGFIRHTGRLVIRLIF